MFNSSLFFLLLIFVLLPSRGSSQSFFLKQFAQLVAGDVVDHLENVSESDNSPVEMIYNRATLKLFTGSPLVGGVVPLIWKPSHYYPGTWIENAVFKQGDPRVVFILLRNGSVYRADLGIDPADSTLKWSVPRKIGEGLAGLTGSPGEAEIIGDALYIHDGSRVFVSRDSAETWQLDTAGLSGYVEDLTIDTSNFVWAATSAGIFSQHPDSNIWHKNPTFPVSNCRSILADRRGRLFVGAYNVYSSTDGGVSWTNRSGSAFSPVTGLSDDAYGNIYAVGFAGGYRSSGGTSPWVNVSDTIAALVHPSTGSYVRTSGLIRAISGDTVLHAATVFGLFRSSDAGDSWQVEDMDRQIPPERFYGVAKSGPRYLLSTPLGVQRVSPGDTIPEQVLPDAGFRSGISLSTDSSGNVYAIVPVDLGVFTTTAYNYRSTDNGTTWSVDSAGLSQFSISFNGSPYFVDDAGTQYVSNSSALWIKHPSVPWRLDTLGLHFSGSERIVDVSRNNRRGVVYALKRIGSTNYELYSRARTDSLWQQIDVSAFGATTLMLSSDENGDILLTTRAGEMSRFDGMNWTPVPLPTGIPDPSYPDLVSVSDAGVIWSTFKQISDSQSRGLFFTEDDGTTWSYAGLDSVEIDFLLVDADTTYAVTRGSGIHGFTAPGPGTDVSDRDGKFPAFYGLDQNYPNPFNPTTIIGYELPRAGSGRIVITDIIGKQVRVYPLDYRAAGTYTWEWDGRDMSGLPVASGTYFYSLIVEGTVISRKMLLVR